MDINTYTILECKREDVEKKLKRLQKKAEKYDIPFSVSFGEPYAITRKEKNEYNYIVENMYEVFDLTIESDVIRKDGYTVIAHIEHATNGNIVNVFEGDVQKEWVTMPPFCEHCNSNHNLKFTFIVANGAERKQVGRTCLKDYCGIDPQVIGMFNAFYGEIEEDTFEGYDFRERIDLVYDSVNTLGIAIDVTKEQGYIKSDERNSNKSAIIKRCSERAKAFAEAEQMAKDILAMPLEEAIDAKLNNVQVRLQGLYCKPSDFGYFAYAPTAYKKHMERKAEKERRAKEQATIGEKSAYVGTVGERMDFDIKEMRLLTSFPSDYGYTYLYRFIDKDDNVLIWFASSAMGKWVNGEWVDAQNIEKIKATVKSHSERDGVKQTIITRVKEISKKS